MARPSSLDAPMPRGFSLLEAMIALTLLLVGILGLMQLQLFGITSNQGARANGTAQELARELASALERLDPTRDDLLKPHVTSAAPPSGFGNPLDSSGELATTGWTDWKDDYLTGTTSGHSELKAVGVRPDSALEKDQLDASKPNFRRRWSVWQLQTANQQSGVRLVAVSVVYRERTITRPRVATVYVQIPNLGASTVNAAAYR
jgi:type II secretory pathway pseudopilin PulG